MNYIIGERYATTSDIGYRRHHIINFSSVKFETTDSVCFVNCVKNQVITNLYTNTVMLCKQAQEVVMVTEYKTISISNLHGQNEFDIGIYLSRGLLSAS